MMDSEIFDDEGPRRVPRAAWPRFGWLAAVGVPALVVAVVLALTQWVTGDILTSSAPAPIASQTRVYYIAADHVQWNYAPDGSNDITGKPFDDVASVFTAAGP